MGFRPQESGSFSATVSEMETIIRFLQEAGPIEYDAVIAKAEEQLMDAEVLRRRGCEEAARHGLQWAIEAYSAIKDALTAQREVATVEDITGYQRKSLYDPITKGRIPFTNPNGNKHVTILDVRKYRASKHGHLRRDSQPRPRIPDSRGLTSGDGLRGRKLTRGTYDKQ